MLSPESRRLLDTAPVRPPRTSVSLQQNRDSLRGLILLFGEPHPTLPVREVILGDGVPARIYGAATDSGSGLKPGLVYCHGGGWALGDLDTHDALCRRLAVGADCAVVAIDYRQPPEHPYPAALEDVVAALRAVHELGDRLGIDRSRIAVGGDSAGGNLAAAASLQLRGTPYAPRHQVLILPVVDNRPWLWPSYTEFAEGYSLSRSDMEWYLSTYLGQGWRDVNDPGAAPIRAEDLRDLPGATVLTAECDPLRDEGEAYAHRLEEQGVTCELRRFDGTFHPFILFGESLDAAREAVAWVSERLRWALDPD